jgi:hypothetical protein
MKFETQVLVLLGALCCSQTATAFVSRSKTTSGLAPISAMFFPKSIRAMSTHLFTMEDDEDEDEDNENNPLGKGVNSVAWLPSVIDRSGEELAGVKEVSIRLRI